MILPFIKESGAHRYVTSGEVILADGDAVMINTVRGGKIKVTLKNNKAVHLNLKPYTTTLIDAKSGKKVL